MRSRSRSTTEDKTCRHSATLFSRTRSPPWSTCSRSKKKRQSICRPPHHRPHSLTINKDEDNPPHPLTQNLTILSLRSGQISGRHCAKQSFATLSRQEVQ